MPKNTDQLKQKKPCLWHRKKISPWSKVDADVLTLAGKKKTQNPCLYILDYYFHFLETVVLEKHYS